jgi:FkbM family methyltransferase
VDVGANIGFYSAIVAAFFGPDASVIAFEPAPILNRICANLFKLNGLLVDLRSCALGAEEKVAPFYISPSDVSNSLAEGFRQAKDIVEVRVARFDAELADIHRQGAVLKIDTESTEGDVLKGAELWIARNRPWIVCEVLHKLEDPRISTILTALRYKFYHIRPSGLCEASEIAGEKTYKLRDWLFAPHPIAPTTERRIAELYRQIASA